MDYLVVQFMNYIIKEIIDMFTLAMVILIISIILGNGFMHVIIHVIKYMKKRFFNNS